MKTSVRGIQTYLVYLLIYFLPHSTQSLMDMTEIVQFIEVSISWKVVSGPSSEMLLKKTQILQLKAKYTEYLQDEAWNYILINSLANSCAY